MIPTLPSLRRSRLSALLLALGLGAASCAALAGGQPGQASRTFGNAATSNVLLIIIDDIGPEQLGSYSGDNIANAAPATTPNLDSLAASGVRFRNAWGFPVCSPSRAAMYTGRYPLRTKVGAVIDDSGDNTLSINETTLADVTKTGGLSSALIGKWHLGDNSANGGTDSPRVAGGFDRHAGTLSGALQSYTSWMRYVDGVKKNKLITTYATTFQFGEATTYMTNYDNWFVTLSLNAPHTPYHIPTSGLYTRDLSNISNCDATPDTKRECYKAAIEAVDSEVGRMLANLASAGKLASTTIIVVGDNGTPTDAVDVNVDSSKAKGTVYQRGLRVPMIISGQAVQNGGRVQDELVSVTDIYATIAELTGLAQTTGVDSVSMVPYINNTTATAARATAYAETFTGDTPHNGSAALRDSRYKLIENLGVYTGFYDLQNDPEETVNLINAVLDSTAQASLTGLKAQFDTLHGH